MTTKHSVALIGAGAMGGALFRAWLDKGAIDEKGSAVFDPAANEEIKTLSERHGVALNPAIGVAAPEALVLAVKPQIANDVLPAFAPLARDAVVVSVMAGRSLASVAKALGGAPRVARAMPNLPAAVGRGVTGVYAPAAFSDGERALVTALMAATGDAIWVEAETQIDFVTAISGSGPAYFLLLVEALEEAGASLGLSKNIAERLARATLTGAGALADADARSAADMRRAVTSPKGTTEAALKIFDGENHALRELVKDATAAAARRARALTD